MYYGQPNNDRLKDGNYEELTNTTICLLQALKLTLVRTLSYKP